MSERETIETIKWKIADIYAAYGKDLVEKALAELPDPDFVFLTDEQIAKVKL